MSAVDEDNRSDKVPVWLAFLVRQNCDQGRDIDVKRAIDVKMVERGHFDPKKFEDHYETALVELLRKKHAGRAVEPVREEGPAPRRVINLMDALRASIGAEKEKKPAAASTKAGAGAGARAKRETGR